MTGDVEFAETTGSHNFPRAWGRPAGDRWSEERATWVKDRVCQFRGLAALQELESRDKRYLLMLQTAVLMARRNTP